MNSILPINMEEAKQRGWNEVDFVVVTGDCYVDHPSFGTAIIARVLEHEGFKVGIMSQPMSDSDYLDFGKPKYGFMVGSGNIDSMVNNYTAAKRKRSDDSYSAGGKAGKRPDRALTVYTKNIKRLFPQSPVFVGGIEASLRRFAHYDYWSDSVMPSVLVDSGADFLVFGMSERQTRDISHILADGKSLDEIRKMKGVSYLCTTSELPQDYVSCASFKKVSEDKTSYAKATKIQMEYQDGIRGKTIVQKHGDDLYVVQNPPEPVLARDELDEVFALPFTRTYHPSYEPLGGVPAIKEVEFSIMHNRGCFGHCNFCSITYHQGRQVSSRSKQSVIDEAIEMTHKPNFKGYIHDIGGPSANFRYPSCQKQIKLGMCKDRECLGTKPCPNLIADHSEYVDVLRSVRAIKGVKRVFIRSGIRYDYVLKDKSNEFMDELVKYHVSGQLKVAPEHCSNHVLDLMGKPHIELYEKFMQKFYKSTEKAGKKQFLVPYLMSSHPGSTLADAVKLAEFLNKYKIHPEQVQDFYPTPGSISTCMFYSGINPLTMEEVYVPRSMKEKQMQRVLLQYYKPENRREIIDALICAKREDLIGTSPNCLVPPTPEYIRKKREEDAKQKNSAKNPTARNRKPLHKDMKNNNLKSERSGKRLGKQKKKK